MVNIGDGLPVDPEEFVRIQLGLQFRQGFLSDTPAAVREQDLGIAVLGMYAAYLGNPADEDVASMLDQKPLPSGMPGNSPMFFHIY